MINETQLKVCRMCKHRNLTVSRGMVCKLTDDVPNFENQCPTFEYDENRPEASYGANRSQSNNSDYPVWRILLSIVIIVFSIVRISNSCSKNKEIEQNNLLQMNQFEQNEMQVQEAIQEVDQMSLISPEDAKELGIIQIKKDSIVKIDKGFSFTIPSNYYTLTSVDDDKHVVLFLRSTQNESVVIYKMKTSIEKLQEDWKTIRETNAKDLVDFDVNAYAIEDNIFKYKIHSSIISINGKAKIIKTNNAFYVVQFESATTNVENIFVRADDFFNSYINN